MKILLRVKRVVDAADAQRELIDIRWNTRVTA